MKDKIASNPSPSYAWVVLTAIFVASVAAPINQFKVPPVMPALIAQFGLTMTQAGFLMSIFSLAGLLIAFPAGALLARLGQKKTVMMALFAIAAGSVIGTFSESYAHLISSRALEGAGMAVLGVCAPVVISGWFAPEKRGLPMGIWSAWVSTGVIIMMNASPEISPAGQWRQTWWLGTGITLAALLIFMLLHRNPQTAGTPESSATLSIKDSFLNILALRDVWLISVTLLCFNIMVLAMNSFFPTYLFRVHGIPLVESDFFSSLPNLAMLISCPLGGWIADRTGFRKQIFACCLGLLAIWWLAAFSVPVWAFPILMAVFGLLGGPIISTIVISLPEAVKNPALIGFGMSLLMFWHHLGEFIGPVYFGKILDLTSSWPMAGLLMVPVCLIGCIAALSIKTKRHGGGFP